MKKTGLFTALLTLLFCTVLLSQGNGQVLQNIVSKMKTYGNNHITEQAYLSFDKPYYSVGDTLYFKAFLVIGERHEVSQASGILHVDLVGPSNNVISDRILKVANGTASGDFELTSALQGGIYRVRAYTRYMENTPDYFFDKPIMISGNGDNSANIDTHQATDPDIQFFPEGGELISSLASKVAFKAIGANGLGIKVKGQVIDNTNAPIANFESNDLGMGSFFIQPEDGKTYKAKVLFSNGKQSTINLPAIMPKGVSLRAKDTLGKVSIDIVCNKAYLQDNMNKDINLLIYSGGSVRQVTTKLDSREMGMDVAEAQFPSGVLRITLFSQDGEPLSERLVFLQGAGMMNVAVSSDKQSYKTREKVSVSVAAKSDNVPVAGSFSAAVVDESRVPFSDNDATTILSYLLLTSELKGYIEKPNYYFAQHAAQAHNDLDVLMMTQGYRHFTWKQLDDTTHFTFAPEKSLSLSGIEKTSTGQPLINKDVMLIAPGGNMLGQKTDKSGQFIFDNMDYDDGGQFTLQATGSTKDKSSSTISVVKPTEPAVVPTMIPGGYASQLQAYTNKTSGGATEVQANVAADQELTSTDVSGSQSLTAALKSHLNGVSFISGAPYLKGLKYPMLIVIDGKIRASDVNLDNISTSNVADIKLLKGKNAESFGTNGSSGVLVINTRYGSSESGTGGQSEVYQAKNSAATTTTRIDDQHYRSSSISGPGHADQVIHADALKNATSMTTGLSGVLHGVDITNGYPYLRGGSLVGAGGQGAMSMYIIEDGVALGNVSIDNINPHSVETVEVLRGPNAAIYGSQGSPGVLVITTKTEADGPAAIAGSSIGSLQFRAHGYYKAREFYSPKYNVASQSNTPDLRSTLYWSPNLTTDQSGNGSFEFYNSDGHGSFRVIVEGMDAKGNIGWQVYRYKVE